MNNDDDEKNALRSDTPIASDETVTTLSAFSETKPILNLQERTRQSISLAPQQQQPKKHSRSRTSQIFPVNQFETPQKPLPRRSTIGQADAEAGAATTVGHRDITPREKLFEEDVEYSSVFKARPKLARSPKLSPFPDSGHGSMESAKLVDVDVDVELESPLKGR